MTDCEAADHHGAAQPELAGVAADIPDVGSVDASTLTLEPGALSRPLMESMRKSRPPWSAQAIVIALGLTVLTWVLVTAFGAVRHLFWWATIAAFLYFAMAPAVDWLVRHRIKRGPATGLVLLGLVASFVGLATAMTPLIVTETQRAIAQAPLMMLHLTSTLSRAGVHLAIPNDAASVQAFLAQFQSRLPAMAGGALSVTGALVAALFEFFVILLLTFFLLANQDKFRRFILSFLQPGTQRVVAAAWDIAVYKTGGYLYSRILTSVLAGTVVGIAMFALGADYPMALAVWYGIVSQFIPMVGTYIAASLPLVILALNDPKDALIFLIVLAAWIPFQDYVVGPKVSAKTMELAPASALLALLAGGALFGALGAFLALPAAAVIQSVLTAFFPRHEVVVDARGLQSQREQSG